MATPELNKALSALQKELPTVEKGREGKNEGTSKQGKPYSYTYGYADLFDVSEAIMPLLGKHGLAYIAEPSTSSEGKLVLDYALLHASGEERAGSFPLWMFLRDRATAQDAGGLITYFRRYCLCAVTGVAPKGEDDDAAAASQAKPARPRPVQRPSAPVTKTRTTGPDHERLRQGTVEATPDDRRAQRGPLPEREDRWRDQPAGKANGISGTVGLIQQHFKRLEVADREERLVLTARLADCPEGRELTSTNDLSEAEAARVLSELSKCRDHGALMALVVNGERPSDE